MMVVVGKWLGENALGYCLDMAHQHGAHTWKVGHAITSLSFLISFAPGTS